MTRGRRTDHAPGCPPQPRPMDPPPEQAALQWLSDHGDLLYSYALPRVGGDAATAEDLVQETLLAALKADQSFKGESSRGTWLVGILRHKIIDHYRRAGRRPEMTSGWSDNDALEDLLAEGGRHDWRRASAGGVESQEFAEVLSKCLENINPALAQTFILVVMDGLTTEEACSVLEITPTNLSVRLCRARLELRRELNSRWFDE